MLLTLADFERDALDALTRYTAIPALSPMFDAHWEEHGHIEEALGLLVDWCRQRRLAKFEVAVQRLANRTPLLVVTVEATNEHADTVVLYGHLDKQPPLGDWSDGLGPFSPVRRGNRLFGRGVADDGYSTFAALLALEALEAAHVAHGRYVVLIEASEESGSPDLEAHLDALATHLGQVELMICLDSGALTYDRLWVTTSLRGVLNVELTVKVLSQGQHSGVASGVVPSSFRILRELLDRVEDSTTGEVLVPELQATIPDSHVRAATKIFEEFGDVVAKELPTLEGLRLMGRDGADRLLRRTWAPTLSIVGMGGIPTPDVAGNVLRPSTTAVLSFRLPPSVDAEVARAAVERLLTTNVPANASVDVHSHAASGWVAPPLSPWLDAALEEASRVAFGREPGFTGEGGTIPFLGSLARRYPSAPFVATGVLGPHSNAHGIDEMLDLDMAVGVTNAVISLLATHAQR
ncbi:MAG: M20/M25/M40 family metallo-hydrolase [Acidobacteriota bacterium]|nr:M20/M25/M40 family metallo-hydrolase [Acidobacteriota bacterium]